MKYAGIGSRKTPNHVLRLMEWLAHYFATKGYVLRSGGAEGADTAFALGHEIVQGARSFELFKANDCTSEAMELSAKYHLNWGACSSYVHKLHGRNAMIILGRDLNDPVNFVLCWTPEGKAGGGTGQGIRIAKAYDIPVIDLGGDDLCNLLSFEFEAFGLKCYDA